jgi:hypothetical protein
METRASYIVTGAFTLAVIAGVFGFLYWVQNGAGGGGERSVYRVVFCRLGFRLARWRRGAVRRHAGR